MKEMHEGSQPISRHKSSTKGSCSGGEREAKNLMKWFVFLGPPGCGKGSQVEYLVSDYAFDVVSVGGLLRNNFRKTINSNGETIGDLINAGSLLPDHVVVNLVEDELKEKSTLKTRKIIFDGFPRTIGQAKALSDIAIKFDREVSAVLNFIVGDEVILKRIMGRYKCSSCGKIYNEFFFTPKEAGACDVCNGSKFDRRDDDNEESLKKRLLEHNKNTQPLIDFYSKCGILYDIDADADFENVKESVLSVLNLKEKKESK